MNMLVIRMSLLLGILCISPFLWGQEPEVARPMLFAQNLKAFCISPEGEMVEIHRDITIDQVASLRFCLDLSGNEKEPSGVKSLYFVMQPLSRRFVVADSEYADATFNLNGTPQPFTTKVDVNYVKGRPVRTSCVEVTPSKPLRHGAYRMGIYCEGKLIEVKRLHIY